MKKKTITTIALAVIITASLSIAGISAYFTALSSATNRVPVGNNDVTITETFSNPSIKANKVTTITKTVTVVNTGINTAAVRVRADFSNSAILDYTTVDYNTDYWTQDGDYWYYNSPLAPGEKTEPLFNELVLDCPSAEQIADFDVYVYSETKNCEEDSTLSEMQKLFLVNEVEE